MCEDGEPALHLSFSSSVPLHFKAQKEKDSSTFRSRDNLKISGLILEPSGFILSLKSLNVPIHALELWL